MDEVEVVQSAESQNVHAETLRNSIEDMSKTIADQNSHIGLLQKRIWDLQTSLSYRVGRFLLAPVHWVYEALQLTQKTIGASNHRAVSNGAFNAGSDFAVEDWKDDLVTPVLENKQMTIIIHMPFMAVGGAEHLACHIIRSLPQVQWVVLTTVARDASLGSTAGIFEELTPYVYPAGDQLVPEKHFSFIEYLVNAFNPEIFYISNGSPFIYDCLPALKNRYPEMILVDQVYDHQQGWIDRYSQGLGSVIDLSIGANPKICRAYIEKGALLSNVRHIEHCIDTSLFDPRRYTEQEKCAIRTDLGIPEGKKVVAFMGRLHSQKRPMDFVELARRFTKDDELVFLMVGDGDMSHIIAQQVEKTGLTSFIRTRFYTPASDVLAVIDLLVLPSSYEGMPLVIMEAQAMGIPVVATDVGNNREFLEYTGGGVVVPEVGDVNALQDAVKNMLEKTIDTLSVREKVVNRVDRRLIAEKYLAAFVDQLSR